MKRSTAKLLFIVNMIVMIVAVLVTAAISNGNKIAMYCIGGVFLVIALILGRFLRCPSCYRSHNNWMFTEYCPYCGKYLGD